MSARLPLDEFIQATGEIESEKQYYRKEANHGRVLYVPVVFINATFRPTIGTTTLYRIRDKHERHSSEARYMPKNGLYEKKISFYCIAGVP
jgi:hypothetical protein